MTSSSTRRIRTSFTPTPSSISPKRSCCSWRKRTLKARPRNSASPASGGALDRPLTLGRLAERIGARVDGDPSVRIDGVNGIREAGPGEITFLANPRYARYLESTRAAAVIVSEEQDTGGLPCLRAANPYRAFLQVLEVFAAARRRPAAGVHPTAQVSPAAVLGDGVALGPFVVVEDGARIGDRTVIETGVYVGRDTAVGSDCRVYPRAVLREETQIGERVIIHSGAVIGADGFGFIPDGDGYRKIPQIGRVVLEDDVEVGANTTIDRATVGETRVKRGTRIDNLVQVAHNVVIGENSILCAQVGISGSTEVGRNVTLAGQVGVVGHIRIGDGVKVGAQGGVTKSVPDGQEVSGYPATPHALAKRIYASMRRLPEALSRLREIAERLERLERKTKE
ncbi:MAG: UDP-3-O-(3-hydroxymyristoyl)glucosamine N-acyltransferase [Candidatus Eisenbacteria bacterium]|nr:UDP-3-O-(3-hydroxymyristoyl)glucosamine N-acyltransferase [Candidatus Eisenbacteria bacterium]